MTLDISSHLAGDSAIIEVADNGVGLADAHKVFEPFFTTKTDGMGMGLSICRSIVNAHEGRLWAEARKSRGAVFRFELPVREAALLGDRETRSAAITFSDPRSASLMAVRANQVLKAAAANNCALDRL